MRRSVLLVAIALMLTPACKEEGGKARQSDDQQAKKAMSSSGKRIVKIYDTVIASNKNSIKLLRQSKAKLKNLVNAKTINEAIKLQSDAIQGVVNSSKLLNEIDKLLVAARKSQSLTVADTQLMTERSTTLKALSKKIITLSREVAKAAKQAQIAINEKLKARLRELQKQSSK